MALDPRGRKQFQQLRQTQAQGGQMSQRQQQRFDTLSQQRKPAPVPTPAPQQPSRGQLAGAAFNQLGMQPGSIDPNRIPQGQQPPPSNLAGSRSEGWGQFAPPQNYGQGSQGEPGSQWKVGFNGSQPSQNNPYAWRNMMGPQAPMDSQREQMMKQMQGQMMQQPQWKQGGSY